MVVGNTMNALSDDDIKYITLKNDDELLINHWKTSELILKLLNVRHHFHCQFLIIMYHLKSLNILFGDIKGAIGCG